MEGISSGMGASFGNSPSNQTSNNDVKNITLNITQNIVDAKTADYASKSIVKAFQERGLRGAFL
jgi:hypothetical protein